MNDRMADQPLLPPEEFLNTTSLHWVSPGSLRTFNIIPLLWNPEINKWTGIDEHMEYRRVFGTTGWKWVAHIPFPTAEECLSSLSSFSIASKNKYKILYEKWSESLSDYESGDGLSYYADRYWAEAQYYYETQDYEKAVESMSFAMKHCGLIHEDYII